MNITNKNLQEYRGDTVTYNFQVDPSYLTTATCFLTVKRNPDDTSPLVSVEFKSTDTGANWTTGKVYREVTGHNTDVTPGLYVWDLRTFQGTTVKTHYRGEYFLIGNITDLGQISTIDELDLLAKLQSTTAPSGSSIIGVLASFWASIITPASENLENVLQWLYNNFDEFMKKYTRTGTGKVIVSGADNQTVTESTATITGNNLSLNIGGQYQINGTQIDTDDVNEGTNLYYTDARFDTRLSSKNTDDLAEGATNKYYLDARVKTYLETLLSSKGRLLTFDGTNLNFLLPGTDSYVLTSNSSESRGLKWEALSSITDPALGYLSIRGEINSTTTLRFFAGGVFEINGTIQQFTSNNDISQVGTPAASWYYILIDSAGSLSLEPIPIGHIIANTIVYMPNPDSTYDANKNGHYSTVTTTDRIIANAFWDSAKWSKLYTLKTGYSELNLIRTKVDSNIRTTTGYYTNGTINLIDIKGNGLTITTSGDIAITANAPGNLELKFWCYANISGGSMGIRVYLNGSPLNSQYDFLTEGTQVQATRTCVDILVKKGDEIKFYCQLDSGTLTSSYVGDITARLNA